MHSGAPSSYRDSAGPTSNDYEPPMLLSSTIHLPGIDDEQVSFPRWRLALHTPHSGGSSGITNPVPIEEGLVKGFGPVALPHAYGSATTE